MKLSQKYTNQNFEPIDTFTLTRQNIKDGEPLEGSSCPVAYMLGAQYERIQYEDINIDRMEIGYECQGFHITKENSWTLLALIHTIDHPNCAVFTYNTQTGTIEHIFGGDKGLHPPYTIEEYEHYFNLILLGYEKAHLDTFTFHTSFNKDEELSSLTIHFTPHKEPSNE